MGRVRKSGIQIMPSQFTAAVMMLFFASLLLLSTSADAAVAKKQYREVFDIEQVGQLRLLTKNSSVNIRPWRNRQIRIQAEILAYGRSYREAQQFLEKVLISTSLGDSIFVVGIQAPKVTENKAGKGIWDLITGGRADPGFEIEFTISVPREINLDIRSSEGLIEIQDISGNITAETTEESISIDNIDGAVSAYTTNAPISVKMSNLNEDRLEFSTSNADINLYLPSDAKSTIQAKAVDGKIDSEFDLVKSGPYSENEKHGWINGGGTGISLFTVNGSIAIKKK